MRALLLLGLLLTTLLMATPLAAEASSRLPDARVGDPYSYNFDVTGLVEPVQYQIKFTGQNAPGIAILGATLVGTPTSGAAGLYEVTLLATGALDVTLSKRFRLNVRPRLQPLAITNRQAVTLIAGRAFTLPIGVVGGEGALAWTLSAASLPAARITCDPARNTCAVTGTAPDVGTYDFTLDVVDAVRQRDSVTLEVQVFPPPAPALELCGPGEVVVDPGSRLDFQLCAQGGYPPYAYAVNWLTPKPAWMAFSPQSGRFSGQVEAAGAWRAEVTLSDARNQTATTQPLSFSAPLLEARPHPFLFPTYLYDARVGEPYDFTLLLVNRKNIWDIARVKNLPDGISAQMQGDRVLLFGEPTTAGDFNPAIIATTNTSLAESDTATFTRRLIVHAPRPRFAIATTAFSPLVLGEAFTLPLGVQGGTGTVTWSIEAARASDAKLVCNEARILCRIEGRANELGTLAFTVSAQDEAGARDARKIRVDVKPPPSPLSMCDYAGLIATVGAPFDHRICTQGGYPPFMYRVDYQAYSPGWLSQDGSLGRLTGVPSSVGRWRISLAATDRLGQTARTDVTLEVKPLAETANTAASPVTPIQNASTCDDIQPSGPVRLPDVTTRDGALEMQLALAHNGHYAASMDGQWGPGSRRALSQFRASVGLSPEPTLDDCTYLLLKNR